MYDDWTFKLLCLFCISNALFYIQVSLYKVPALRKIPTLKKEMQNWMVSFEHAIKTGTENCKDSEVLAITTACNSLRTQIGLSLADELREALPAFLEQVLGLD